MRREIQFIQASFMTDDTTPSITYPVAQEETLQSLESRDRKRPASETRTNTPGKRAKTNQDGASTATDTSRIRSHTHVIDVDKLNRDKRISTKSSAADIIGSNTEESMTKLLGSMQKFVHQQASRQSKLNDTMESMGEKLNSLNETLITGEPSGLQVNTDFMSDSSLLLDGDFSYRIEELVTERPHNDGHSKGVSTKFDRDCFCRHKYWFCYPPNKIYI